MDNSSKQTGSPTTSGFKRIIQGQFGLAVTYWTLYLVVAVLFFILGSIAVADERWGQYLTLLGGTLAWTFLLVWGVSKGYQGKDPGKAIGRVSVLFLLLNITNALATLSFI
ncbi:hypothetical protein GCM10011403_26320 [Pseudohongiella nitratireducens]|jgi:hypothetical protein|uniref:Uncharacterized protein n=1 Tax=Pseudohongiella nitratireducens TaxID=1768907 RepID=A0A916VJQ0_9GAMM|nr:hypothetical protein [Pseudohongiella nitratireducens]GFZ81679.1 hypothetical protein GCM10011403_26320 [Pseudohongiella nitratireducens]